MSTQRIGKYACLEIEKRLLLVELPPGLTEKSLGWQIEDRYFPNTRMRLRRMRRIGSKDVIYKLTQKFQADDQDATQTTITNLYLTEAEYRLFAELEAQVIEKRRFAYHTPERKFSIDVFDGRLSGLILAETEFETMAELAGFTLPDFALRDVTDDRYFTGGHLAEINNDVFRRKLVEYISGSHHGNS
ncbi:MAG: hypothetical protein GWN30_36990 [Gammaproteobacteria bacterium]|nr:hypothetical protein [Gammaproteobacteria bacterium]